MSRVVAGLWLAVAMAASAGAADQRRSGFEDMGASTQALQRDDSQNPGWLWVKDGEKRFAAECATCHSAEKLHGAAARYPAFDDVQSKPVTLAARINLCRQRQARLPAFAAESDELIALEAYLGRLARGLPIRPDADARLQPFRDRGEVLYRQRIGQLDFSCAQCHDQHPGGRLAGSLIPQAHPTGYPIYRLEWQGMGSLQRRLRNCMTGVRAEPYAYGSNEYTAIELYLKQRSAGLPIETPAVRP